LAPARTLSIDVVTIKLGERTFAVTLFANNAASVTPSGLVLVSSSRARC
jgi:hypothetical protein